MSNITFTNTPPPNFFAPCRSTTRIFSSSTGELINPISNDAFLFIGGCIIPDSTGEFSYPKSILSSPSFTIIMRVAFTNAKGGINCLLDAYPKLKIYRNGSNDFGITWRDTDGQQRILIPSSLDVGSPEEFEVAVTRMSVSPTLVITKLYFNGELVGEYSGKEADSLMNDTIGDYVKLTSLENISYDMLFSLETWNGTVLDEYAIRNHYSGLANYYYNWENSPATDSWSTGMIATDLITIDNSYKEDSYLGIEEDFLTISDTYTDVWGSVLNIIESIIFTEKNPKTVEHWEEDFICSITDDDAVGRHFKKNAIVPLIINDMDAINRVSTWNRVIDEPIGIAEYAPKEIGLWFDDYFMLYEDNPVYKNDIIKGVPVTINFEEKLSNATIWNRIYTEALTIAETGKKLYDKILYSTISFDDQYVRHADAVISDIEFRSEELTAFNFFDVTQSPTGYTPFRDFISGDYTYQEALIRLVLSSDITADRPYVEEWTMNVDVPDVTDRGVAQLTAVNQPLFIPFNKFYHVPPEVVGILKTAENVSGELPSPAIYNITREGFYVVLKSGINYSEGSISWTATGY